ncbi:DUF3376 domain-containing protein [Streptomyces sp. NBC_01408]|uniref:DUF3376 domain-containing protein n=1 Tax=Streptomyces sp. NBC_01408 TaxID=2903855 RepID=UPI00225842BF|nr:DUF3376 domain-containing protein [Streptomyces sp. NBC_01408]MCX4695340.1 DUF3376 domain-containing protein [Streptomyces sp. NBC_01408]
MSPAQPSPLSTELRLALAMRGGVSLAVWMGGSCCEVAALRSQEGVYGPLLKACEYEDVTVDVLAGTSAGGLNGVLLACHLVYGMPFGQGVRDVWLELGDLESLLRDTARPGSVPDSLLRGDEVFYPRLRAKLEQLIAAGSPPPEPPAALRLILTATRLRPRPDRVRPTLGQPLLTGRSRAYFRFRHRTIADPSAPPLTDFPTGAGKAEALNRLAYAARASSSFPGAFEPARPVTGTPPRAATEPPEPPNLWGISSETGYPDPASGGRVELVDGGLLDNIPVAWALRAIAGSPADRSVDRWLLFLQPVPPYPAAPEEAQDPGRVTRLLRLALKSFAVRAGAESLLDDAAEFQAVEDTVARREGLTGVLPATLGQCVEAATGRLAAYRRLAGSAEARRLVRLLQDPVEVTGADPLPLPGGPGPLDALDTEDGDRSVAFLARVRSVGEQWVLPEGASFATIPSDGRSPMTLARCLRLLLEWICAFERSGQTGNLPLLTECRTRLYAHRLAVATFIAARDRAVLHAFTTGLAAGTVDPLVLMGWATDQLDPVLPAPPTDGRWDTWAARLACKAAEPEAPCSEPPADAAGDPAGDSTAEPPSPGEALYARLWESLVELGRDIGLAMCPGQGGPPPEPLPGFGALHQAAALGTEGMETVLAAAEVLLGPLHPDPLAEPVSVGFHTVSAANASWATERLLGPKPPKELVEGKLSGNQLSNFSAFLSARWRLGDWIWGRLDAAASLVRVAATDRRLEQAFGNPTAPGLFDEVAARLAPSLGWLPGQLGDGAGPDGEAAATAALARLWAGTPSGPEPWDRLRHLLTQIRQREILAQELPMVAALVRMPGDGNRPQVPQDPPEAEFDTALKTFSSIGSESLPSLLRAPDPRRAALRAGLLAWPALQPSGERFARLPRALLGLLKPFLCLPEVFALVAPLWAAFAASLAWVGIAFSAGSWFSPPGHTVLICAFVPALAVGMRIRTAGEGVPRALGRLSLALLPAALLAVLLCAVADVCPASGADGLPHSMRWLIVGATMTATAGAALYVGSDGDRHWEAMAGVAVAAGVLAFFLQSRAPGMGPWWAVLILYAVLGMVSAALNWLRARAW